MSNPVLECPECEQKIDMVVAFQSAQIEKYYSVDKEGDINATHSKEKGIDYSLYTCPKCSFDTENFYDFVKKREEIL